MGVCAVTWAMGIAGWWLQQQWQQQQQQGWQQHQGTEDGTKDGKKGNKVGWEGRYPQIVKENKLFQHYYQELKNAQRQMRPSHGSTQGAPPGHFRITGYRSHAKKTV